MIKTSFTTASLETDRVDDLVHHLLVGLLVLVQELVAARFLRVHQLLVHEHLEVPRRAGVADRLDGHRRRLVAQLVLQIFSEHLLCSAVVAAVASATTVLYHDLYWHLE